MRLARTRNTCSFGGVGHAASTAAAARRHVPARRLATVPAAADAETAAAASPALEQPTAPAEPELAALAETLPASAVSGSEQRQRDTQQRTAGKPGSSPVSSSSSSSTFAEAEVVAVSSTTNTTSAAAFIANRLIAQPDATLRLNSAGGPAGLAALKMLAKAGKVIADKFTDTTSSSSSSSSPQLTFQVERRLVDSISRSEGAEGEDARGMRISVNSFFVTLAAAGSFSADLLGEHGAPMVVRIHTEPSKITQHALYYMRGSGRAAAEVAGSRSRLNQQQQQQQQAVAAFVLDGSQLPARVKVLLRGLSDARRKLYVEGKADLRFTVERSVLEFTEEERQEYEQRHARRQQQQQQDDSAAAGDGESAAAGVSSSNEQGPMTKAIYIIRAYSCKPKLKAGQAARRSGRHSGSSSSDDSAGMWLGGSWPSPGPRL